MTTLLNTLVISCLTTCFASAGAVFKVTSKKGEKTITYEVDFGGGMLFEKFTAFDPESGQFVYLNFDRDGAPPKPATKIFDHTTGKIIKLYKFPNVENPLPIIPTLKSMKVCPKTGDKNFKAKTYIHYS